MHLRNRAGIPGGQEVLPVDGLGVDHDKLLNCYRCGVFSYFFWGIDAFREDACSLCTK